MTLISNKITHVNNSDKCTKFVVDVDVAVLVDGMSEDHHCPRPVGG